ncbi:MAG: hypothetical protein IJX51_03885 [Clostridia bacterium]|nr:hypothetical protein [Clostridia bacterium]
MKIKMKIKYRKSWLFILGIALLLTLLVVMAVAFIFEDHNYGLAILCSLLGVVILVAIYFRFNFGITISEKRVVAVEQAEIKILRYDDVSSITVKFTDESIVAYIKMKNQQEYVFVWDNVFLGTNVILPSENKIKLNDQFVGKSIASLSKCEKVKIQNFYTPRNK